MISQPLTQPIATAILREPQVSPGVLVRRANLALFVLHLQPGSVLAPRTGVPCPGGGLTRANCLLLRANGAHPD